MLDLLFQNVDEAKLLLYLSIPISFRETQQICQKLLSA